MAGPLAVVPFAPSNRIQNTKFKSYPHTNEWDKMSESMSSPTGGTRQLAAAKLLFTQSAAREAHYEEMEFR